MSHGLQLYNEMQCSACHGAKGRGDGELAMDLTDTAGKPIQPADLTRQRLKSGNGPQGHLSDDYDWPGRDTYAVLRLFPGS